MATQPIIVPDLGDFSNVDIIEILVKTGDSVKKEDSLITLETDKASMDVPAPADGVIATLTVKVGDKVSPVTPSVPLTSVVLPLLPLPQPLLPRNQPLLLHLPPPRQLPPAAPKALWICSSSVPVRPVTPLPSALPTSA